MRGANVSGDGTLSATAAKRVTTVRRRMIVVDKTTAGYVDVFFGKLDKFEILVVLR